MNYRMLAVDLDGTLLGPEHQVTETVRHALNRAREKGVKVVIATGRMFQSAVHVARELGIDVPLITYNGALIQCALSQRVYCHRVVDKEEIKRIVRRMKEHPVEAFIYLDDELYVEQETERAKRYGQLTKVKVNVVGDLEGFLQKDPTMLLIMGEEHCLNEIRGQLQEEYGDKFYITKSFPTFLEIMHPNVSKAEGIKILANQFGIRQQEIIAIGDNYNDLEMINFAGLGVAVRNAPEQVREQADYVTEKPYGDGVVEVIEKFILIGR